MHSLSISAPDTLGGGGFCPRCTNEGIEADRWSHRYLGGWFTIYPQHFSALP